MPEPTEIQGYKKIDKYMFLPKNQELINNYTLLTFNTNFIVTVLTFCNESNWSTVKLWFIW